MFGLFIRNANEIPMMTFRRLINVRFLSQTNRAQDKSSSAPTPTPTPPSQPPLQTSSTAESSAASSAQPWQKAASASHKLSNFDKRILVWSGKYKSVDDIPSNVAPETINRARDQCRVKACLWMMLICAGGCIIQIIRGKRAAERGETIQQANIDWHRQYNATTKKDASEK